MHQSQAFWVLENPKKGKKKKNVQKWGSGYPKRGHSERGHFLRLIRHLSEGLEAKRPLEMKNFGFLYFLHEIRYFCF